MMSLLPCLPCVSYYMAQCILGNNKEYKLALRGNVTEGYFGYVRYIFGAVDMAKVKYKIKLLLWKYFAVIVLKDCSENIS